jgi:hypothetical protein
LTNFTAQLRSKNLFYQFIRHQIDTGKLVLTDNQKNNLVTFLNSDIITEKKLQEFLEYVDSKNILPNYDEFQKDKEYTTALLKAYIAKEYFNSKGWYSVLIPEDEQVQKSLELLNEAKEMIIKNMN